MNMRGFYAIGIYQPKNECNMGTLWRSAYIFGASFIFTIGRRYRKQASDTLKTYRHIPLFNYSDFNEFYAHLPYDAKLVCVEIRDKVTVLTNYVHPQRAIYMLGSEDGGIPEKVTSQHQTIIIDSVRDFCLNVATAGSIVMYDRMQKMR